MGNKPEHLSIFVLKSILKNKYSKSRVWKIKTHINNCKICWSRWNKTKWNAAKNKPGFLELKKYLDKNFNMYYDSSMALAQEWNDIKPKGEKEIEEFYINTKNYLYTLIVWHESGARKDYRYDLKKLRYLFNISSVIDFGCGVGNDGLWMMENGFDVKFIDINKPCLDFLKWRLKKRRLKAKIISSSNSCNDLKADLFWAIDVLEHIPKPEKIIKKFGKNIKIFVHESYFGEKSGGRHPFHFDYKEAKLNKVLGKYGFRKVKWKPPLKVWQRF